MHFNPSLIGSGWIIVFTFSSALATVFIRFTQGTYSVPALLLPEYAFLTIFCFCEMRRRKIPLTTLLWKAQAVRIVLGIMSAGSALLLRQNLPICVAQTFLFSTPIYIVTGLLISRLWRGQLKKRHLAYLLVVMMCGAMLFTTLMPSTVCIPPLMIQVGVIFGVCSAGAALCIKYLGDRHEPTLRTVFYFSTGACLVGIAGTFLEEPATLRQMLTDPALIGLAMCAMVCQLTKVYGWGYCSPWLNAVFLFSGIPMAWGLGYVFFDEALTAEELQFVALVTVCAICCAMCRQRSGKMKNGELLGTGTGIICDERGEAYLKGRGIRTIVKNELAPDRIRDRFNPA